MAAAHSFDWGVVLLVQVDWNSEFPHTVLLGVADIQLDIRPENVSAW
jgi:hypothetical protein